MTDARSFYTSAEATEHYLGIRWPKMIWQAVLMQAMDDFINGPDEFRLAARDWIDDTENEPRRFEWVCDVLGYDPVVIRNGIYARATK